jgi:integrase
MAREFLILTAARSGEVLGAQWNEIDFDAKVWMVPAARMKAGREHRVPLSDRAMVILSKLAEAKTSTFVFPGPRPQKPLSKNVDVTVHGFPIIFPRLGRQ